MAAIDADRRELAAYLTRHGPTHEDAIRTALGWTVVRFRDAVLGPDDGLFSITRAGWATARRHPLVGPGRYRCGRCGQRLRRLTREDLDPGVVRSRQLAGTLGGILGAGYVCNQCTEPGCWVLIE